MNKRFWIVIGLGVLFAGMACALEAGAGKVEITPELGVPLAGTYQRMGRGAVAVHDPLWVRALYLDDGDTRVFLVSADLCAISPSLRKAVLERAPKEVARENIILTATHTMSGPGGMVRPLIFRIFTGRYMPELIESMAGKFGEAMRAAYDNRKRATIGFGTSNQEDVSRNTMVEDGPVDSQLGVLRVNDSDGNALAIVGNFGVRCGAVEIPGPEMLTVSADYPGYFCAHLEELAGPDCVALFLQGACGDVAWASSEDARGWEHAEAAGKLLAEQAFETAQKIKSDDVAIKVARATPELPRTLADAYLPSTAPLATLEVGDLAMLFVPGEPCAKISTDMRSRCLERGYTAQFTVGMANDYRFYFVPRSQYSISGYESMLAFYGPAVSDWFCMQFSRLLSRGEAEVAEVTDAPPAVDENGGIKRLILRGRPYQRGYMRGAAFRQNLLSEFEQRYAERAAAGEAGPQDPFWAFVPDFAEKYLATENVTVPWLAMGARPMLAGLPDPLFEEMAGMAAGADVPFDATWLVQCGPTIQAHEVLDELTLAPFCTMFAAVGMKAGADDILIGRNLDWPEPVEPVVYDVRPEDGLSFLLVGFPWSGGGFSGMNEAGVVLCVERNETLGKPALTGPPIELVVAHILEKARTAWVALEMLELFPHLEGYQVLVGDPHPGTDNLPPVRVMELGEDPRFRAATDRVLLGVNPENEELDDATRNRYLRLAALIEEERNLNPSEIEEILSDTQDGDSEMSSIFNANTRYSVVFEPKARRVRMAVPGPEHRPGAFVHFGFETEEEEEGAPTPEEESTDDS
ncbi:MAG: neutral/alkaline non-lysosomal ceramidase N-terminal domain-containing protein [Candidatus Hydrogenedentota bacterium]